MMASTSGTPSLFKRMKKGSPLSVESRQIILNVLAVLLEENPKESLSNVVFRVASLVGVSKSTVWRLKSDGKPTVPLRHMFNVRRSRPKRADAYDTFTLAAIRRIVHDGIRNSDPATFKKISNKIHEDDCLPTIEKCTLRRLIMDLGFIFAKGGAVIDGLEIQATRRKYLRALRKFREDERPIYYLDETWVNDSRGPNNNQQPKAAQKAKSNWPWPKGGQCLIIAHAGNEKGFVNGAQNLFVGEMDDVRFESWFTSNLLPNIPKHSIIVMDDAHYHSVPLESIPSRWTGKVDIQNWLSSKGIGWSNDMVVPELMYLVDGVRERFQGHRIDTIAQMAGHVVLRLPPYHGELNPIELVWRHIKDNVAAEGDALTLQETKLRAEVAIALETKEEWANAVQEVIKVENEMWDVDNLVDSIIDVSEEASGEEEVEEGQDT